MRSRKGVFFGKLSEMEPIPMEGHLRFYRFSTGAIRPKAGKQASVEGKFPKENTTKVKKNLFSGLSKSHYPSL